ncbi:hypothetical protein SDC9_110633 [bioreactor metagenome]|uniref:Uncharacterized protein n=1 Tax=bioreactor metagenome TaxID=1076179 RepID=A0A645BE75_9ZZZZ
MLTCAPGGSGVRACAAGRSHYDAQEFLAQHSASCPLVRGCDASVDAGNAVFAANDQFRPRHARRDRCAACITPRTTGFATRRQGLCRKGRGARWRADAAGLGRRPQSKCLCHFGGSLAGRAIRLSRQAGISDQPARRGGGHRPSAVACQRFPPAGAAAGSGCRQLSASCSGHQRRWQSF